MSSFRDSLPADIWRRMRQELGCEETLRLLWPVLVGAKLGCYTRVSSARNSALRVVVPDQVWSKTLGSMQKMILDSVNGFWGEETWRSIEFVEETQQLKEPKQPNPLHKPSTGRQMLPPRVSRPSPQGISTELATGIRADDLREAFLQSAKKYFARQEERRR